jgi:hypothetical protein
MTTSAPALTSEAHHFTPRYDLMYPQFMHSMSWHLTVRHVCVLCDALLGG